MHQSFLKGVLVLKNISWYAITLYQVYMHANSHSAIIYYGHLPFPRKTDTVCFWNVRRLCDYKCRENTIYL